MNDLYETDILLWSERQADALRRRAANEIDWDNVAEEIEDVGSEQLHAAQSLLTNIIQHRLHLLAWPQATAATHWQREIVGWRVQVRRRFRRSRTLRRTIEAELPDLYADALTLTYDEFDGAPRAPLPEVCPWTLDELLAEGAAALQPAP
jgi:hypothetical protein